VVADKIAQLERSRRRWRAVFTFVLGLIVGVGALFALALLSRPHL
jgi:hypothetical protein